MAGKLITLPLRVSLRSARLLTRAAGDVAGRAVSITEYAIGVVSPARLDRAADNSASAPAPETRAAPETRVSPAREPAREQPSPARRAAAPPVVEPPSPLAEPLAEPSHVSEEPELIAAIAEPGAEEGAGARITVKEPWAGYGRMNAQDVIDRARLATVAELAAIRLYEARHRARRTVLVAVERQLKLANGGHAA
jgi:hypothetical protein